MTEKVNEEKTASDEVVTQVSPEIQRALDLMNRAKEMVDFLNSTLKKVHEKDSQYYNRTDEDGKEIHRMIGWHIHDIVEMKNEMRLSERLAKYILTGVVSLDDDMPESVPGRLEYGKKHYGLESILDT